MGYKTADKAFLAGTMLTLIMLMQQRDILSCDEK